MLDMNVDPEKLTAMLASRLAAIVPVSEASHEPWPGERSQPEPYAQVRGDLLHRWYGGPDIASRVVLACEPVPLGTLTS